MDLLPTHATSLGVPIYALEWQVVDLWEPQYIPRLPIPRTWYAMRYTASPSICVEGGHVVAVCFAHSGLERLPHSLLLLPGLKYLNIAHTNVHPLPVWLIDLPSLHWLKYDSTYLGDPVVKDCMARGLKMRYADLRESPRRKKKSGSLSPCHYVLEIMWENTAKYDKEFWEEGGVEEEDWDDDEEDNVDEETKKKWEEEKKRGLELQKKSVEWGREKTAAFFRQTFS